MQSTRFPFLFLFDHSFPIVLGPGKMTFCLFFFFNLAAKQLHSPPGILTRTAGKRQELEWPSSCPSSGLDLPQPCQTQDILNNRSQAWHIVIAQQNLALSGTFCPALLLSNVLHLSQESKTLFLGAGKVSMTDNALPKFSHWGSEQSINVSLS